MQKIESVSQLEELRRSILSQQDPDRLQVLVCGGPGCLAIGSEEVKAAFESELAKADLPARVTLKATGCHGLCALGPLVLLKPQGICYKQVKVADVADIVEKTLVAGEILEHLLPEDPTTGEKIARKADLPFYQPQQFIVLRHLDTIDPGSLEDYLAVGGYSALGQVLTRMTPEEVISVIEESGLRGRGGAGFPTGRKWRFCSQAPGAVRYLICNGDEGDPGAFMDRAVMEGDPHAVLEGMLIGAYAIGAKKGFIYVRHEYPLAVKRLAQAIDQAREAGLLGENILGQDFDFDIKINRGAGAFVCGEETALILSIEGQIGEPRPRPPYPAQHGLWGQPTVINNVETWANVPVIIQRGAAWYAAIGTPRSKGTKIFSLVGAVKHTGLVEVPMGTTLRQIVFDIGGGVAHDRKFKAVQTGGPSGGCIPKEHLDLPIDYESLAEVGSIMGSGGLIVMDETNCMVDVARYYTSFLQSESCGKCTPCREGLTQMLHILNEITAGRGNEEHLTLLEELGTVMAEASLCGLGLSAPNPVLSTLRYFRDEYEAHILKKKCPALVCRALLTYTIDPETCTGCMVCVQHCPVGAISGEKKEVQEIDQELCIKCGMCREVCPFDAVNVE